VNSRWNGNGLFLATENGFSRTLEMLLANHYVYLIITKEIICGNFNSKIDGGKRGSIAKCEVYCQL
jgi:hypothetical protein